jgi:hypothetical protein
MPNFSSESFSLLFHKNRVKLGIARVTIPNATYYAMFDFWALA